MEFETIADTWRGAMYMCIVPY